MAHYAMRGGAWHLPQFYGKLSGVRNPPCLPAFISTYLSSLAKLPVPRRGFGSFGSNMCPTNMKKNALTRAL